MTYLTDCWYVAAWPADVGEGLFTRTILDTPIVMYRRGDGAIVALENRCVHRHVPLSRGKRIGDLLECAYHGLQFDSSGRCVRVPGQDTIPPRARVPSYPVVEKHGWVWIWMGDPAKADETSIPDVHRLGDAKFAATGGTKYVKANYELLNDNLLDLSHVGYVHASTIGTSEFGAKGRLKVEPTRTGVRVTRWVIDCEAPPTYCKTGIFKPGDRIDRWQIIDYEPPSFIEIHVGGAPTGTGAPQGNRVGGLGMWVMNAMTPETSSTTFYNWAVGRDYLTSSSELTALLGREVGLAFDQDLEILELQQASINLFVDPENVDMVADGGSVQARRLLRRRIAEAMTPAIDAVA